MTVRVFLVDDHEVVRRGLCDLIADEPDMEVVGEAGSAAEALERAPAANPDVAVIDVRLPDRDGVMVCRDLRSMIVGLSPLILTSFDDEDALLAAVMAGAAGYVLKQLKGSDLVDAIRRVAKGEVLIDPDVARRVLEGDHLLNRRALLDLTPQERRILEFIGRGLTNRQIAKEMFLSEATVKNYVSKLLRKLGMSHRTEAAIYATRLSERPW
jgi:two-component system response regulator DevR